MPLFFNGKTLFFLFFSFHFQVFAHKIYVHIHMQASMTADGTV